MASAAQITANIVNAQLSTGPRTDPGKAAASQNSLKHGLTARNSVLLPGEDEAAYRAMCDGFFQSFSPSGAPERELVQTLCDTQWRIQRCSRLEADALSGELPDFKAFDIISKHQARLGKLYSTTLNEFKQLAAARAAAQDSSMREAIVIRRADVLKGRPTDFKTIGFDFSVQEVDVAINREDALRRAHKVVSQQFAA